MRHSLPRRPRAIATVIAAAALVATLIVSPPAAATEPPAPGLPDGQTATDAWRHGILPEAGTPTDDAAQAREKLTDEAESQLTEAGGASFWVRFADRADLAAASAIADWDERGAAVRDALRAHAEASQAPVIAELEAAGAAYTSFWVSNAVLVTGGDLALATTLAAHSEVSQIREVMTYRNAEPVESSPAAAGEGVNADGIAWGVAEIGAPAVWAQGITGEGIVVANIDSGVDVTHPALHDRFRGLQADGSMELDYNWLDIDRWCGWADGPCDPDGHGTHTMGTITGDAGDGERIGVAPGATWIAANGCVKCSQTGLMLSAQWMLAPTDTSEDWANGDPSKRPHIVNNSWGDPASKDPFFDDIIRAWEASGIFSAWSVGNSGPACDTAGNPGSQHVTYSVGAYDEDGDIGYFSSRGPGQDGEVKPNISAPGVRIRSAAAGGGYRLETGTSMAAPHLAGAVALLWSAAPALVGDIPATRELLDRTARDVDDTRCGGDADDNGVWGEGKLDVAALIAAAPTGAGTLAGTVTAADGSPLVGVDVVADGEFGRSTKTAADGTFALRLVPGTYEVTLASFGFSAKTVEVTVADGETADASARLATATRHTVSGTLTDAAGDPMAGLAVALNGPLPAATTDAAGRYRIDDVPAGSFTLTTTGDRCIAPLERTVVVDGDETVDAALERVAFSGGYSCTSTDAELPAGTQVLDIRANGGSAAIALPFAFPSFDDRYSTAYVSANGFVSFASFEGEWPGQRPIPYPGGVIPGGVIAPFWMLLDLDDASAVLSAETTVDGMPAVTVEWRNVFLIFSPDQRLTFSATLVANGDVLFSYGDGVGADADLAGGNASVGIEAAGSEVGAQYSRFESVLQAGQQIRFTRDERAWLTGTVTDANDGAAVAGATVAVASADGTTLTATTSGDGTYEVAVPLGTAKATVTAPNYTAASQTVELASWQDAASFSPALKTGIATLSTSQLTLTSDGRGSEWVEVTVKNSGSAPLHLSLDEMPRNPHLSAPEAGMPVEGVWSTMPVSSVFGVGYDGRLWVSDWMEQRNGLYAVTGERLGDAPHVAEMDGADRLELAFDSRSGDMCQIINGGDWSIHCFDRESGVQTRVITGYWADQQAYSALAYNPVDDVFYLGSAYVGTVLTVAGSTHAQPGKVVNACAVPEAALGFAYNTGSDTLWYSTFGDAVPQLVQIDPDSPTTCTRYRTLDTSLSPEGAAGMEFDEAGNLWVVDMNNGLMWRLNVEDPTFADIPWLDPNQDAATLKPGGSKTFKVKVKGSLAAAGANAATLLVDSDAGRASRTYLPVDLTRSSR
ncbi:S8 family serine peptidase [Microbacterium sp. ZW T2_14]|uniref:S8 family serine peptidase n=1 Tax=Microbacterium sp. ZW T2_14 TaxID=3378079 RepID=UPI0038551F24